MIIDDLIYVMADSSFFETEIFDLNSNETVFKGVAMDIPDEYLAKEISSIDPPEGSRLCINIELGNSEEEEY